MATFYKPSSLTSVVDTVELDRALHNLEFEKKQQIQELEKEKQQINILEASLKEKQDGIRRMEEDLCRIDEETKTCHKQFRQNREQKESQKAHSSVLNFHLEAKQKEFQQLTEKYEVESAGLQRRLEHYDTIWKSYEEIYMKQANAQELMKWQLEVLQRKEAIKDGNIQIAHLQETLDGLQVEILANEPPFSSITEFIVKLAEMKVSTQCKKTDTEQFMDLISIAEKEMKSLKETQEEILKKLDEKRKEEELEKQRKQKEKEQQEKAQQEELARKRKEEQQNAAKSNAGLYKFGQFLHRAPISSQKAQSLVPPTIKRGIPSRPPQPYAARTPLLNIAASQSKQHVARYTAPQSTRGASFGVPTQTTPSQPSRFLINAPPRSPALSEKGGRKPAVMSAYLGGNRGPKLQLPNQSSQSLMVMNSPSVALADTMYNMNIQTPTRTNYYSKPTGQADPATPRQTTLEVRKNVSPTNPANARPMGPGGDAQPPPIPQNDQLPRAREAEPRNRSELLAGSEGIQDTTEMENVQAFPLTPKCTNVIASEHSTTPKTPGDSFDLSSFKSFGASKSPGFSYSARAMFGDQPDAAEDQSSNKGTSSFQENPFFSSFYGESERFSAEPVSQFPTQMFGEGDPSPSTSAPAHSNQGGAMSMFGNSPTASPQASQPQPESMGFSFNFSGESPSQTQAGDGDAGSSRSGAFNLF